MISTSIFLLKLENNACSSTTVLLSTVTVWQENPNRTWLVENVGIQAPGLRGDQILGLSKKFLRITSQDSALIWRLWTW